MTVSPRGVPVQSAPELGAKPPPSPDRGSTSSLLSPGICSVGTNNSEVSNTTDYIDDHIDHVIRVNENDA